MCAHAHERAQVPGPTLSLIRISGSKSQSHTNVPRASMIVKLSKHSKGTDISSGETEARRATSPAQVIVTNTDGKETRRSGLSVEHLGRLMRWLMCFNTCPQVALFGKV